MSINTLHKGDDDDDDDDNNNNNNFNRFSKGSRISSFIKIRGLVTTELFHTDEKPDRIPDGQTEGLTDMAKLTVAFRSFARAPDNCLTQTASRNVLLGSQPF